MDAHAIVDITVAPKSSRNKIAIGDGDNIKIYITDPPVDGKANAGLIAHLSKSLGLPKSSIRILHGETGKKKRLSITGLTKNQILKILKEKQ